MAPRRTPIRKKTTSRRTKARFDSLNVASPSKQLPGKLQGEIRSSDAACMNKEIPRGNELRRECTTDDLLESPIPMGDTIEGCIDVYSNNDEAGSDMYVASSTLMESEEATGRGSDSISTGGPIDRNAGDEACGDFKALLQWPAMYGALQLSGTQRMTRAHYEGTLFGMNFRRDPSEHVPSDSVMRQKILPFLRKHCYAKSCDIEFPIDLRKSGARAAQHRGAVGTRGTTDDRDNCGGMAKVRIVLPSTWALKDVQTRPIFEAFRSDANNRSSEGEKSTAECSIEDSFIAKCRRGVLSDPFVRTAVVPIDSDGKKGLKHIYVPDGTAIRIRCHPGARQVAVIERAKGFRKNDRDGGKPKRRRVAVTSLWELHARTIVTYEARHDGEHDVHVEKYLQPRMSHLLEWERQHALRAISQCVIGAGAKGKGTRAGDVITVLLPIGMEEGDIVPHVVLVNRYLKEQVGEASTMLLCFSPGASFAEARNPPDRLGSPNYEEIRVSGVFSDGFGDHRSQWHPASPREDAPCWGKLEDGRNYFVYRFLLYTDDFEPFTSRKGSFGGCYMLPLNLPPRKRGSYQAVRVIGLPPPGVSTNCVLRYIVQDIVRGSTEGFPTKNAEGEDVVVFLDPVGSIGDYPAVSHTLDVLGHTSNSPCHICSFRKYDLSSTGGTKNAYTSVVNGQTSTHARSKYRNASTRKDATETQLRTLGLAAEEGEDLPFHVLSTSLEAVQEEVPKTENGVSVVPAIFDPYRSAVIAPDHLLSGLAQDVLNACISAASPRIREVAELQILGALKKFRMGRQNRLFGTNNLLSMNMSDIFSVLLIAPMAFENAARMMDGKGEGHREKFDGAVKLVVMFQKLVSCISFMPVWWKDGPHEVETADGEGGRNEYILGRTVDYVETLNEYCRKVKGAGAHLDKPNVHRLVEFCVHTLPAYGSVKHVQELIFERMHQPLKKGVRMSNHQSEQLSALELVLADDWQTRVAIVLRDMGMEPQHWSSSECSQMVNVLSQELGREIDVEDEVVKNCFQEPVLQLLSQRRGKILSADGEIVTWRGHGGISIDEVKEYMNGKCDMAEGAVGVFKRFFTERYGSGTSGCGKYAEWVRRVSRSTTTEWGRKTVQRSGSLESGAIIHAVCPEQRICEDGATSQAILYPASRLTSEIMRGRINYEPRFFIVLAFFILRNESARDEQGTAYGVCLGLQKTDEGVFKVEERRRTVIVEMSEGVTEVFGMHYCNGSVCEYDENMREVRHGPGLLEGGEIYALCRRDGFPPRAA